MPPPSHSRSKSTPKASPPITGNSMDKKDAESSPEKSAERVSPPVKPGKWDDLERSLCSCSWDELQERFIEAMDERSDMENALQKETADLLEVFIAWSQTTVFCDEDRAYKRFKTRMDYVQTSEERLEDKKQHYANVVKAFESALALLRDD